MEDNFRELSNIFKVFADETRLKIISELFESEKCVGDISKNLNLSQSLVSHQLRILKDSKVVDYEKRGQKIFYFLVDEHVRLIYKMGLEYVLEKEGH